MFSEGGPEQGPEMVYGTRVLLRALLDSLKRRTPADAAKIGDMDDEKVMLYADGANHQTRYLREWRRSLRLELTWEDEELLSTDPLMASLRAEYYNGMAELLQPYLDGVKKCSFFTVTRDKPSTGQQKLMEVIRKWIHSALLSITAFDRVGAAPDSVYKGHGSVNRSPVMLSNPVKTLHT